MLESQARYRIKVILTLNI